MAIFERNVNRFGGTMEPPKVVAKEQQMLDMLTPEEKIAFRMFSSPQYMMGGSNLSNYNNPALTASRAAWREKFQEANPEAFKTFQNVQYKWSPQYQLDQTAAIKAAREKALAEQALAQGLGNEQSGAYTPFGLTSMSPRGGFGMGGGGMYGDPTEALLRQLESLRLQSFRQMATPMMRGFGGY